MTEFSLVIWIIVASVLGIAVVRLMRDDER